MIRQAVGEAFPQTATGENLERFAEGISRNAASGAAGNIVLTGTALSVVPLQTALASQSGQVYRTQATVTLANQITTVSALSSTAGVATAVANGHPYATGQDVTIAGAVDVQNVRDRLLQILPGTSEADSLVVLAPTPSSENFVFTSITPEHRGDAERHRHHP